MAENPKAPSLQGLARIRTNALANLFRAQSQPGFLSTPAGQLLTDTRERLAEQPAGEMPVPPQFGSGTLGALAGLAAAAQGPQAVARQGDRIAKSAAERRQVQQYNRQRVDAKTEKLTALDATAVQMMNEQYRANREYETKAWDKLQSAIQMEAQEAQRLAEREEATAEDKRRFELTHGLNKRVEEYRIEADRIMSEFNREMANKEYSLAERRELREDMIADLEAARMRLQLADPLAALSDGEREIYGQANQTAHQVTEKFLGVLNGVPFTDDQGNVLVEPVETEAEVSGALRKLREALYSHIGGLGPAMGNEALVDKMVMDQVNRAVMRIYERADLGELNLVGRLDIPQGKRESEAQYEQRLEYSTLLAQQRLPQALDRIASTLATVGIDADPEAMLETMPKQLHDAWLEADALGEPLSEEVAKDHREWFEQHRVPVPGEPLPTHLKSIPVPNLRGTSVRYEASGAVGDLFGPRGKVRLKPSKAVGEAFPDDPFTAGKGLLRRSSRLGQDAPPALDPFPEDRADFNAMLEVYSMMVAEDFVEDPTGFGTDQLIERREDAREKMLADKASQVQ